MSLDPEEVVNKRFSATKFRQGYDEEEVDEFLDEVVGELRRLNAETTDLRAKLAACESRSATPSEVGFAGQVEQSPAPVRAVQPISASSGSALAQAPVPESGGVDGATGMLALAQKLHDEHVASGRSQAQSLIDEAQQRATSMVRDAEEHKRETLSSLDVERAGLERQVEDLRSFEREYRSRLKAYLENQLRDLDERASTAGSRSADSDGSGPDTA